MEHLSNASDMQASLPKQHSLDQFATIEEEGPLYTKPRPVPHPVPITIVEGTATENEPGDAPPAPVQQPEASSEGVGNAVVAEKDAPLPKPEVRLCGMRPCVCVYMCVNFCVCSSVCLCVCWCIRGRGCPCVCVCVDVAGRSALPLIVLRLTSACQVRPVGGAITAGDLQEMYDSVPELASKVEDSLKNRGRGTGTRRNRVL